MLELVLKAIITGFLLSIMVGPVFFVLLETSIRRGFKAGIAFNTGVIFSDIIYIAIAYVFYSEVSFIAEGEHQGVVKIVGGVIFALFGLTYFFKKVTEFQTDESGKVLHNSKDYILLFIKGFVLNFMNPLVIIYWFSIMTIGAEPGSSDPQSGNLLLFITILLIAFFSFDILKILGAKQLKPFLTEKLLKALNLIIGMVFIAFSLVLIIQGLNFNM